jgi:uncharacterized membrane protein YbhN (UPF0104 family)
VRTALRVAEPLAAVATLAVVVWRLGAGPFVDGVSAVDGPALLLAGAIGLVTTVCCAWRWTLVARGFDIRLPLPVAVAAYYRSVFLNLTLPGGVAGDVHRGVSHGRGVHAVGRALRVVVWERAAGQVVQGLLTLAVLLVLPSPVHSAITLVAGGLVAVAAAVLLAGRVRLDARSRWARLRSALADDLRAGLLRRTALPGILLASAVVVLGHTATFFVAARTAGITASTAHLLPLALLALLAMVLPSVAGWGPREGVTAWVFSSAGLGASRGAATAVAYGVIVVAASLPGAVVLLAGWLPSRRPAPARVRPKGALDA